MSSQYPTQIHQSDLCSTTVAILAEWSIKTGISYAEPAPSISAKFKTNAPAYPTLSRGIWHYGGSDRFAEEVAQPRQPPDR